MGLQDICTLVCEEGRGAKEISTTQKLLASASHEWGHGMQLHVASSDLQQALDRVSPLLLSTAMRSVAIHWVLATVFSEVAAWRKIRRLLPGHEVWKSWLRQVHPAGRKGDACTDQHGHEDLVETAVPSSGGHNDMATH